MPSDSPLEEMEHREHLEHALEALEGGDKLVSQVTMTIAVLAVMAAIAASLETTESDAAIAAKNDAVLDQNRASDTWAEFQAESLKKNFLTVAASQGGPKAAEFAQQAADKAKQQASLKPEAQAFEAKSTKKNLYTLFRDQGGPKAADYDKEVAKNVADQAKLMKKAKAFEAARDAASEQAEVHERRHGRLTIASTLLHMAIAIATLAIILKRRWPWMLALALSAGGLAAGAWAYL